MTAGGEREGEKDFSTSNNGQIDTVPSIIPCTRAAWLSYPAIQDPTTTSLISVSLGLLKEEEKRRREGRERPRASERQEGGVETWEETRDRPGHAWASWLDGQSVWLAGLGYAEELTGGAGGAGGSAESVLCPTAV